MQKLINFKLAGILLIIILSLMSLLHLLILIGIIPVNHFWGGQLDASSPNVLQMELMALAILFLFILIVIVKMKSLTKKRAFVNIFLWIMFVYFLWSILGNITSPNLVEKAVMAPLSLLMAFFTLRLAIEKSHS